MIAAGQQMYAVYVSDLSRPRDRLVATRSTKAGARRLVRELNRAEMAKGGTRRPLYYLVRNNE